MHTHDHKRQLRERILRQREQLEAVHGMATVDCAICNDVGPCANCGGKSGREALLSTARCRGSSWAEDVARAMREPAASWKPWPAFEARARLIALRKVRDLGGDKHLQEKRARECCDAAMVRWQELRALGARAH